MLSNRVLMAKYNPKIMITNDEPGCTCGCKFDLGETIALYPLWDVEDVRIRDMVCMTCHFWFVHEVMSTLD